MLGGLVAGLLTATAACALATDTRQPPELRPATPAPAPQAPAIAPERPSNADDPRAVIDWLLSPSSVRGR